MNQRQETCVGSLSRLPMRGALKRPGGKERAARHLTWVAFDRKAMVRRCFLDQLMAQDMARWSPMHPVGPRTHIGGQGEVCVRNM